jgi:hypothetical protein
MEGPNDDFRAQVAVWLDDITAETEDQEAEERLEGILGAIGDAAAADAADFADQDANDVLAGVSAWASVASYAVGRVYAPSSPWRGLAGFATKIAARLQQIAANVYAALAAAAAGLGAISWSIGISFPWAGISVSVTWS